MLFGLVDSQPLPHVPGVSGVGATFDLLYAGRDGIDKSFATAFTYNFTRRTVDGKYTMPYGMIQGNTGGTCAREITSHSYENQEDYTTDTTSAVSISGGPAAATTGGAKLSGSFTATNRNLFQKIADRKFAASMGRTKCTMYELSLLSGYAEINPLIAEKVIR